MSIMSLFTNWKSISRHQIYVKCFDDFKYLLVAAYKITNFVPAISINQEQQKS